MRTPGGVILLNGPPSSGKTTIARALWQTLEPPHWYHSLDDFRKGYTEHHWDRTRGNWSAPDRELFIRLVDGFVHSLRAMSLAGHNVISEAVILPSNRAVYLDAMTGLDVLIVGVRCPLDVAEAREAARAPIERHLGVPIELRVPEFDLVHQNGPYDVEVDTSVVDVAQAVESIQAALRGPRVSFAQWRMR